MDGWEWATVIGISVIFGAAILVIIFYELPKSTDQKCAELSTIMEHNNTIVTFKEKCAVYYTNEKNYSFLDFDNPSFGPNSYTLVKKK